MATITHILVLSVVLLAARGAPQDNGACDAWCQDPPNSGKFKCCDKVTPALECPVDRRSPGDCNPDADGERNGAAPPDRCYSNSDCTNGLLCCYDACLGQTCKNPVAAGAGSASPDPKASPSSSGGTDVASDDERHAG